ncbi:MAG: carboxypeptidase-like regulatory domain-containing protein [Bryobacteraceae bacterium]|nr:carboxypeptidase-like regulatory domain-containing protein [Bryobacteraceae bacterium]
MRFTIATTVFMVLLASVVCFAQESRGTIAGTVTDPQGGVVPGAAVTVTNTETNVANRTKTNEAGYFEVNLLNPGIYSITVEATGFKKLVRSGIELQVAGRVSVPLGLEVGQVTQTVEVTAAAPLLDTMSASGGRVVDTRELRDLPFPALNPLILQALTAGMQYTGTPGYTRWFDHAGTSSFNTMGAIGSNEYTIDGAPVTGTGGRVGFVPNVDAVQEFRLETLPLDASYAYTGGAVVNMVSGSGTNQLHGSLFEQHQQQRWNSLLHFTRLAWEADVAAGRKKPSDPKQPPGRYNQYGGSIGGPVYIPKIVDGRDKLFFFFNYSAIKSSRVEPAAFTVPNMPWRNGDFSDILAIDPVKYTVYDPRSARQSGSRVVRTPFPNNQVPILNPAWTWWKRLYPEPNNVPGLVTVEGINNWYPSYRPFIDEGGNVTARIDYNASERHRIFGKYIWNDRHSDEYDWAAITPLKGLMSQSLWRYSKGASLDYMYTLSARHLLNLGVNFSRFANGSDPELKKVQVSYKASDLGLPKYIDERAGRFTQVPDFNISGIASYPGARGAASYPQLGDIGTTFEAKAGMNSVLGNHSLKYGWQERRYAYAFPPAAGTSSGSYAFDNRFVRAQDNTTTASNHGLAFASFLLGLPYSATYPTNASAYWTTRYRAFYIQDDLRLSSRLRVGFGLRYQYESGIRERFNRGLNGGFDFNYRPPFAALVEAAYAQSPIPELPASQFKVMGGTYYLGAQGQPDSFTDALHNFMPNASVVYSFNNKTVIRGGYSWAYDSRRATLAGRPGQNGYSRTTSTIITSDNGLTFCCGIGATANLAAGKTVLNDPFPIRADGTRWNEPFGNAMGQDILQGSGVGITPRDINADWSQRWRVSLQREITPTMMIEVSYNGSWSRLPGSVTLSYLPEQYWSKGNVRDDAQFSYLTATFPNPFRITNLAPLQTSNPALYNFLSTVGRFTATTLQRQQLLRAYPNFTSLTGIPPNAKRADFDQKSKYHDLQVSFNRRMSNGLNANFAYTRTYSRNTARANEFEMGYPYWIENGNTRPHRIAWTAIYEWPFGSGRKWVNNSPLRYIVGGWQTSWVYQYQNGTPLSFGNRFFYGDLNRLGELLKHNEVNSKDIHLWFDPSISYRTGTGAIPSDFVGFEGRSAMQPTAYHVRVFPLQITALRNPSLWTLDMQIKREFRIGERVRFSFSADAMNVTNHTNFGGANTDPTSSNFGRLTSQNASGSTRQIQLNGRLDF